MKITIFAAFLAAIAAVPHIQARLGPSGGQGPSSGPQAGPAPPGSQPGFSMGPPQPGYQPGSPIGPPPPSFPPRFPMRPPPPGQFGPYPFPPAAATPPSTTSKPANTVAKKSTVSVELVEYSNPENKLLDRVTPCASTPCNLYIQIGVEMAYPSQFGASYGQAVTFQTQPGAEYPLRYGPKFYDFFQGDITNPFNLTVPVHSTLITTVGVYDIDHDVNGGEVFARIGKFEDTFQAGIPEQPVTINSGTSTFSVIFRTIA